jgi:arylsulfatase A-like enzyme
MKKNVVVIVADQLRADHLGFVGKVPVNTPHLDALARQSHVFENAYVCNPVCMPNRATIMTGRWPSAHGLRTNGIPLDPDAKTYARAMRNDGWKTSAVGKLHFQPMGYPFEEYQLDEIRETIPELYERAVTGKFGEDFRSWEDIDWHFEQEVQLPDDYYGFDNVTLASGHGDRVSGNYAQWARSRGWDPQTQAGLNNAISAYPSWDHVYESSVPAALHPTTFVTEESISRIEKFAKDGSQFCLLVSFPDPHHPFAPPTEYFHRHDPADMPVPETFNDPHESSPVYIKRLIEKRGTPGIDPMMVWAPTEDQYRHALAAELGSIEFIDDSVGRILKVLSDLDLDESTVVIFTSDHGDIFGDHGLLLKHFSHYQGVLRVPLIIRDLTTGSGVHNELASSADIAPTILDLAGAPALPGAQGYSLRGLMNGIGDGGRTALLVEEDQPFGVEDLVGPVRIRTVITENLRLTEVAGKGITELYDLHADPDELQNLVGHPGADKLLAEARAVMLQEVLRVVDDSDIPFHAA